MREKVVPIPFLGKEVSAWLYRTTRWVREHPYRASGVVLVAAAATLMYEVNVTHRNRIPSPNVNNHLEYELRYEGGTVPLPDDDAMRAATTSIPVDTSVGKARLLDEGQQCCSKTAMGRVQEMEQLLATTQDPEKREELQRLIEEEKDFLKRYGNTTMKVTSGQLYVREPHWTIRNSERNWSILARDQQQQKDHYWYRLERSREDDFARNTYSRLPS